MQDIVICAYCGHPKEVLFKGAQKCVKCKKTFYVTGEFKQDAILVTRKTK